MRNDLSLRRQMRRITSRAGSELLNIVGHHTLEPRHAFRSGKFQDSIPVHFGERGGVSCSVIVLSKHTASII